ncbi:hypothetical protein KI688_007023 [Linnemannia hyalina]|uniref:PiggyBac transposable element-derived protein domain-containing protein n=1 Tax=Linnemannia hyalina TaxID=64524 RepID=A0A9P8BQE9_9FUNG|nr:hypothetical protein KI688_007023 [Linnemannia hyalina]
MDFLGSFDVSDSQGTVVASAEEEDEAQEELLFSDLCRTRPTPRADSSGDDEEKEKKAGDEGVIDAPTPPTKKKAAKKPARETRELPPVPDFENIFRHYKDRHPAHVDEYWSTSPEYPQYSITHFMTLFRFQQLKRYLHVFHPNEPEQHWFSKVEPVMDRPVSMLFTVHALSLGDDDWSVVRDRRRPRETSANAKPVRAAYKGQSRALLPIQKIIDDYNHHMNGVDIADQLRSYYSTQLRTYRAWVPIFFWLLDTTIINAYLINRIFGSSMHHREFRQPLARVRQM